MKTFKEFRMPPMTMGRDNTIVGVRDHDIPGSEAQQEQLKKAKDALKKKFTFKSSGKLKAALKKYSGMDAAKKLAEVKNILQADIVGLKHISDIEIRFSDEKEWKRMSALVKKELKKPAYKGIKDVYFIDDPLQIGFGDPKGKSKINIKPIVDLIVKQTKDPKTRLKSLVEGKITWQRGLVSDGTMKIGIFDGDKEKALEAARQLIIFLRKNKRVKIGGDKEDTDGEPNEAIAKYSEELSKLIFDDELLDSLEPDGNNADQTANDIVLNRLRDLGVNIR